jgi:hypothetical protein
MPVKYPGVLALAILSLFNESTPAQDAFPKALFPRDVRIEVARQKTTKIEGGDYDDRTEKLSFKISLQNSSKTAFKDFRIEFFLFGQSLVDKKVYKLMQLYKETYSLEALKPLEIVTPEVKSMWDDAYAVFGEKYKGWILRFLAPDGTVLVEKSTSSFFSNTKKLPDLKEGEFYTKDFESAPKPRG